MRPLGLNKGAYHGETIDIDSVLASSLAAARKHGWRVTGLHPDKPEQWWAAQRGDASGSLKVYLSAGIHGDEPAGPLAMQRLLTDHLWPENLQLWICPCLNPTGFPLNQRENRNGADLNRDYRHLRTDEVRRHVSWLQSAPPFDVTFCLHEDWEARGFYLYELNPDKQLSLAETMIDAIGKICPIDDSTLIDGRPAKGGIIRPELNPLTRPDWPEAFYLIENKTGLSYTLEAPSDYPLATRVDALVTGVRSALENIRRLAN